MKAHRPAIVAGSIVLSILAVAALPLEAAPSQIVCAMKRLDPEELETLTQYDMLSTIFGSMLYSGLVSVDERGEFTPDLAERWQVSADGLTWTFFLRRNLKYHDGTPVVATDAAAIYQKILDPAVGSPYAALYRMVKSVTAEGTDRVRVTLSAPYGPLPYLMMRSVVPDRPASPGVYAPGTGPFRFVEMSDDEISFEANENYYTGRPKIDRLVFRMYPDQKKAWVALLQGEADAVTDLEREDFAVLKNDPRFRTWEMPDSFCYSLIFNTRDPMLAEPGVRRAIARGIDRDDLIDRALQGAGMPVDGPFLPGSAFNDPDPSVQAFDPVGARKLLADLGWKDVDSDWVLEKGGRELAFTILVDAGDTLKEAAVRRIQWQLLQIGVKVDFEFMPLQQLFGERLFPGKFQAVLMQTNALGDPDQMLSAFWHSSSIGRSNLAGYRNPEVDRLIDLGRTLADADRRRETYRSIHRILAADSPAAFLFVKKRYSATSAHIAGVTASLESFYNVSLMKWYIVETSREGR